MVFLWCSYTFSSGPVAVVPPPVAAACGCPAPPFLWFPYGFPTLLALARWAPPFLWFSYGCPSRSALSRRPEYLHRLPPPAGAGLLLSYGFLWLSYTFRMLQNASECASMLQNASECFRMRQHAPECSRMLPNAPECRRMPQHIPECFRML